MAIRFLFNQMARIAGRGWFRRPGIAPSNPASPPETSPDPYAYSVDVSRDEAALGRFVKRLSVSGAEKIRVEPLGEDAVRVTMRRPGSEDDWEATLDRLLDRCGLSRAGTPGPDRPASVGGA